MSPFDWTSQAIQSHVTQIERLFGAVQRPLGLISRPFIPARRDRTASSPAVNIYTDPSSVIVACEVAGIPPEALSVHVDGDVLTITVQRPQGAPAADGTRPVDAAAADAPATRHITLPFPVVDGRAQARCRNGVLTITLTRPVDAGPRTVPVSTT